MDQCIYCKREVSAGSRSCEDCGDFETAVRIADHILDDCRIESAALAASLGAEIMREYFQRSIRGGRARATRRAEGELPWSRTRSLS